MDGGLDGPGEPEQAHCEGDGTEHGAWETFFGCEAAFCGGCFVSVAEVDWDDGYGGEDYAQGDS